MSGGRLKIQHFAAGELIPALEGFDAVSKGTVEMNCANSYFWSGKTFAAQYFTAVPFGMNALGMNAWLYHGGGQKLWEEVYAPFDIQPLPMGNTGVQMTGWFRKPIEKIEDFKGLKMRIPGLAGKVLAQLGVDVKLLPARRNLPRSGARRDRCRRIRRPLPGPSPRPAQGGEVSTTRPAGTRRRPSPSCHQQEGLGDRCRRTCKEIVRSPPPRATPSARLVRGDERRSARRPRQNHGVKTRRSTRIVDDAAGNHEPPSGRIRRQGPAGEEGSRQLHRLQVQPTSGPASRKASITARSAAALRLMNESENHERRASLKSWPDGARHHCRNCIGRVGRLVRLRAAVLVMACNVLLRYLFRTGSVAMQELEWHLMAPVSHARPLLRDQDDGHVQVDILYGRFQRPRAAGLDLISCDLRADRCASSSCTSPFPTSMQSYPIGERLARSRRPALSVDREIDAAAGLRCFLACRASLRSLRAIMPFLDKPARHAGLGSA